MPAGAGGEVEVEGRIWEVINSGFGFRRSCTHRQRVCGFCRAAPFTSGPLLLHEGKLNELGI